MSYYYFLSYHIKLFCKAKKFLIGFVKYLNQTLKKFSDDPPRIVPYLISDCLLRTSTLPIGVRSLLKYILLAILLKNLFKYYYYLPFNSNKSSQICCI